MNYFSTVKIWVKAGPGDSSGFDVSEQITMKKGLVKNSQHIPTKTPSISTQEFRQIIAFLINLDLCSHVLVIGLLLTYFTMARQSNIVMTTSSVATSSHVIKFGDIKLLNDAILVTITSTKTRYHLGTPSSL